MSILICPIRSNCYDGNLVCPYDEEECYYDIFEDENYIYELCPCDIAPSGECMARRIDKETGEVEIVVVEVIV